MVSKLLREIKDYENDKKEDFAVRFASRSKILVIITERNREQG